MSFSRHLLRSAKPFSSFSLSFSTHIPSIRLIHSATINNMPATIVKVPVIEDIHRAINKAVEDHKDKDVFIYFYASIDPDTGKSWCPDCVTGTSLSFTLHPHYLPLLKHTRLCALTLYDFCIVVHICFCYVLKK